MTRHGATSAPPTLLAGALSLDFANTAAWHASARPREGLRSYADLVAWSRRAALLDAAGAARLLREARRRPAAATAALHRATGLREALYRIAVSLLRDAPPDPADLDLFNGILAPARRRCRVVATHGGLAWARDGADRGLDGMLGPIAESAAGLLTSDARGRLGQCADDRGCGWLFLDTTKNHSRRWCEMGDCGNRAKARRHRQRALGARAARAR